MTPGARDADDSRDRRASDELDRIVGYEANYAGTSFVKATDIGKLMMGSKLFNVTCESHAAGRHVHGGV
jgi:hypothetical protein